MTLIIVALDALDAGVVEHFQPDTDTFVLESAGEIETFAHSKDSPFTPEVWATVATGRKPTDHGVTGAGTSEWENPLLELGTKVTGRLPESTRGTLGRLVRRSIGQREKIGSADGETMFDRDGAVVRNWPGVTDGGDLQYAWDLMNAAAEDLPRAEFERELLCLCAEQFAWAKEMIAHDVSLAGVHVHTLDAAGHAYAEDETALRHVYERVAGFVEELVTALEEDDELLVLSDHGMRTAFYPGDVDENPATHSWRAYATATTETLPASVYDVVDWVDEHWSPATSNSNSVDIPMDQLRELGYVE